MSTAPRLNATVSGFRCSKSGRGVPVSEVTRPLGLCSCCPGAPLLVEYVLLLLTGSQLLALARHGAASGRAV